MHNHRVLLWPVIPALAMMTGDQLCADDTDPAYYHEGPLAGSLKSADPLPIYDDDPQHLWNRLFAAFYIRPS